MQAPEDWPEAGPLTETLCTWPSEPNTTTALEGASSPATQRRTPLITAPSAACTAPVEGLAASAPTAIPLDSLVGAAASTGAGVAVTSGMGVAGCRSQNSTPAASAIAPAAAPSFGQGLTALVVGNARAGAAATGSAPRAVVG